MSRCFFCHGEMLNGRTLCHARVVRNERSGLQIASGIGIVEEGVLDSHVAISAGLDCLVSRFRSGRALYEAWC
jgi:hypothetical protein